MLRWTGLGLAVLLLLAPSCGAESASHAEPANGDAAAAVPDPQASALEQLAAQVSAAPDDPQRHRALARALYGAGKKDESVEHFERVAQLAPELRSFLDLALVYGSLSRLEEAERAYGKVLELAPGHPVSLHNLGNIAFKRGETEKSIGLYRRALERKPDYVLARMHLADALKQDGRYREAYSTYESVIGFEPTSAADLAAHDDALYEMAALDITMGAHDRAAQLLTVLLEGNPDHPSAHYALGQALLQLGRPDEAQKHFETHLEVLARQPARGPAATGK